MPRYSIDLRFIEIEGEIWALGEYLARVEPLVQYLINQDRIQTEAKLLEAGRVWDEADTQIEFQNMHERSSRVFPRFVRGPFVVALWACYESAVFEIADNLAGKDPARLRLRDIRGDHFLDRASRYFATVLHVVLDEQPGRLARIRDLLTIRNALAHANGLGRAVPDARWVAVQAVAARVPTISLTEGFVDASSTYLETAHEDVAGSLRELVLRARGGPTLREIGAP